MPTPGAQPLRRLVVLALLVLATAASVRATEGPPALRGTTSSEADGLPLPGVVVAFVLPADGTPVVEVVSDHLGAFVVEALASGTYDVRASADGFAAVTLSGVTLRSGETAVLDLRLPLAALHEDVRVVSDANDPAGRATASDRISARLLDTAPLGGDDFRALLPMLPGVIRRDDGKISLKGGRPDQSGLQVSDTSVTDPVTGGYGIELPMDAIDTVEVLASPYAAEYGRFSSGVTRIETRRSANAWRVTVNNFVPIPRIREGRIKGLMSFGPRLLFGGAILEDRLFLTQSLQYETARTEVPNLPEGAKDRERRRFNSFTRLDAYAGAAHAVTGTVAVFPRDQRYLTLDTFNPIEVTPDLRERGVQVDLSDNWVLGSRGLLESRLSARRYDVSVLPQGPDPMVLAPAGRSGHFFLEQRRKSHSLQWIEAFSRSTSGPWGEHLIKAGFDLLHSAYRGTSDARAIEVVRADGTRAERLEFPGVAELAASGTDLALFAQDRWRLNDRVLIEAGLRVDRDGVVGATSLSPRLGATLGILPEGRGIVRGGAGLFSRRTPLAVATFESLEPRVVTSFDHRGAAGPSEAFVHRRVVDRTPRAVVWSVEYNHRLSATWRAKVGHLRRRGTDEYVVVPQAGAVASALVLDTSGRSRYAETEVTFAFQGGGELEGAMSYVRSSSTGDVNDFDRFFGNVPWPILEDNVFARTEVDVPHRLVARGTLPVPRTGFYLAPLLEVRSGFPHSAVDERQRFVGTPYAAGRFPALVSLDLAVNRVVTIKGRRVLIGVRSHHLLNTFAPRDVQQNVDSGAFRTFSNPIVRRFGLSLQILP